MVTFLFWNINKKPLEHLVAELADEHRVDVLILAECRVEDGAMLLALNENRGAQFHQPSSQCEGIKIFTRFSRRFLTAKYESARLSIRKLALPARSEVLLVALHFPGKLFWSDESQAMETTELVRAIQNQEKRAGHSRTVVVGDFNMNPFEHGMVASAGLHGVMAREVASRQSRIVQGRSYDFFYNPMWAHLGDSPMRPPGTYYYERAEHVNYYWNVFDQVLIRPGLLDAFDNTSLRVLTGVKGSPLILNDGRPDQRRASDHLPLLFSLNL